MSIIVTSTPNTEVAPVEKAEAKPEEVVEQKESAEAPEASETTDESETLEAKEGDEDTEVEEAEGSEGSEEIKDEEAKEDKPKKKSKGIQERINKLTKRASTAAQERDYWKQVALDKQALTPGKERVEAKPESKADGKPKAEDFESHEEWEEAVVDWKVDQKLTQHEAKQKEAQVKTEHQSRIAKHVERVKAFAETHEDFDEALEDVNDVNMSLTVQECILGSDNGPELMYALAKDRKEYERICALPAIAAARELGKFEARLAKPQPQKTKAAKAPSPIKPVGQKSSGGAKKSLSDPNLSQAEFERIVMEQAKQKSAWG